MIFYLAFGIAKLIGEDLLARSRKGNLFDRLFLLSTAMSCCVFSIAIPFGLADPTSVPLSVGVLTGLMWLPFSAMMGHWVGYFHTIARTMLLVAAWYLFPAYRFVVLPGIIVGVYVVSIIALARRWTVIQNSNDGSHE
jgi:ethanolamine transporter EutH